MSKLRLVLAVVAPLALASCSRPGGAGRAAAAPAGSKARHGHGGRRRGERRPDPRVRARRSARPTGCAAPPGGVRDPQPGARRADRRAAASPPRRRSAASPRGAARSRRSTPRPAVPDSGVGRADLRAEQGALRGGPAGRGARPDPRDPGRASDRRAPGGLREGAAGKATVAVRLEAPRTSVVDPGRRALDRVPPRPPSRSSSSRTTSARTATGRRP